MMSEQNRDDLLQLIPAYVLGALEEDERKQVETLLAHDAEAQAIERDYRQIEAVLLFAAVNRQASPVLKDRLLQRIREDDTVAPDVIVDEDAEHIEPDNVTPLPRKEKRKRRPRRFILPVAAAVVLAVIGLVFVLTNTMQTGTPQEAFRNLYSQRDAEHVYATDENTDVRATLLISADSEQAALRVQQLPQLNEDQIFQLWLVDPEGVVDGGIYAASDYGELYIVIPNDQPINTYTRFGMSIEPAGGSPLGNAPTGDRVFAVDVPTSPEEQ